MTDSLQDALEALDGLRPTRLGANTRLCSVGVLLAKAPSGLADRVQRALKDERISSSDIAGAIKDTEWRISSDVLRRHRRGDCRCGVAQ
jgi:hypothetical protein